METSSSLSILYLFFALAIGGTLTFALTRYVKWLDYTVFLFLAGVATSLVVSALPDSYGYEPLKDSILQWTHIDPKLILFAFLPTMLFGETQTLNLGQVKRIFAPAFLVAVPCLLMATVAPIYPCYSLQAKIGTTLHLSLF
jgi:hypothetical protein